MKSLALLFLLSIISITIVSFDNVLAESIDDVYEEITVNLDGVDDSTMDESETMDEMDLTSTDDSVEEETEKLTYPSPIQQLRDGVAPHEIQCNEGLQLVFRTSNFSPTCVKESSYKILLVWGWLSDHDPTHDDELMASDDVMDDMSEDDASDDLDSDTEESEMEDTEESEMEDTEESEIETRPN